MCNSRNDSTSANINYDDFLNQLFFKVNFTGFQQAPPLTPTQNSASSPNLSQFDLNADKNKNLNGSFQAAVYPSMFTLKFRFKPGSKNIYENIFSLCLEMGLCTLNEIYDYPFAILFPVFEAINWSRENPCFSWPSYAFDLIGRNDLAILKANSDSLTIELLAQQVQQNRNDAVNAEEANEMMLNENQSNLFRQQGNSGYLNKFAGQSQASGILTFGSRKQPNRTNNNQNAIDDESNLSLSIIQNSKCLFE